MSHTALLAGILALAASAALDGPSLTAALLPPDTRLTALEGDSCSGAGEGARCPGLGGASVVVGAATGGSTLALSWSARTAPDPIVAGVDTAEPLQWRGRPTSKGFEPYAVIVGLVDRNGVPSSAVLRVGPREACLVGTVAGRDAEEAARRLADERAPSFRCRRDRPVTDEAARAGAGVYAACRPGFHGAGQVG